MGMSVRGDLQLLVGMCEQRGEQQEQPEPGHRGGWCKEFWKNAGVAQLR